MNKQLPEKDLFGNEIKKDVLLRDKFIEPPFSVLDTKSGSWQKRKRLWLQRGIRSESGREDTVTFRGALSDNDFLGKRMQSAGDVKSVFDPALCEVLYHWFCPEGGTILDPFAGGSVRGIVAHYLDYYYTGIELRKEQIESNREQALDILPVTNQPNWYVGDSNKILDGFTNEFDFVFSCPPYFNLEKYSELEGELSNMNYENFLIAYRSVIRKSCKLLKYGAFACFVVAEIRNKNGNYIGFVPDTVNAFLESGMKYYNECILLNPIGTAMLRTRQMDISKKLVKVHQNILIFRKDA